MASRNRLIALSVIVAVLAVVVILDGDNRGQVRTSRRLVPELTSSEVTAISVRRADAMILALRRDAEGGYRLGDEVATIDDGAVEDFTANLELLACRRSGRDVGVEVTGLDSPTLVVDLDLSTGERITLTMGTAIAAIDRVWLARGERICLVDGYAARALDRGRDDLRARRVFDLADVTGVELHAGEGGLVLSGRPLAVHLDEGGVVRADPALSKALLATLSELRLDRFIAPDSAGDGGADGLAVRLITGAGAQELVELGACPGAAELRAVRASPGSGCVSAQALATLRAYVGQRDELFDRHLVAATGRVSEIAFSAAPLTIRAAGHGFVIAGLAEGEVAAESVAVKDWLERIDQLAGEPWRPLAAAEEIMATITISYGQGRRDQLVLARVGKRLTVARRGEAVVWSTSSAAIDLFMASPGLLRERQLLRLEPFSLRRAQRRRGDRADADIERGQLLEDWVVHQPAGHVGAGDAIARLREVGGRLRAQRFVGSTVLGPTRARISLEFDGSRGGDSTSHVVTIGAATDAGCRAELDGAGPLFTLSAEDCATLLGPWSKLALPTPGLELGPTNSRD